jgi:hypothetical protein
VPERKFAVVSMSNADPNGIPFNQAVISWALQTMVGVTEHVIERLPFNDSRAREIVGNYENDGMTFTIRTDGARLTLEVRIKPAFRKASERDLPPDPPPYGFGLLPGPGDKDEYIVTSGAYKGQRGFFTRDEWGVLSGWISLAGQPSGCRRAPRDEEFAVA